MTWCWTLHLVDGSDVSLNNATHPYVAHYHRNDGNDSHHNEQDRVAVIVRGEIKNACDGIAKKDKFPKPKLRRGGEDSCYEPCHCYGNH